MDVIYQQSGENEDLNEPGNPVTVRVTAQWSPILPDWGPGIPDPPDPLGNGSDGLTLVAESTMYIAN